MALIILFVIICNIYPYFGDRPYSTYILYPNAFALKLGLVINGLMVLMLGMIPYLYTVVGLRSELSISGKKGLILIAIFVLWTAIPGFIVLFSQLLFVMPYKGINVERGFSIYYGYLLTTIIGVMQIIINPILFILLLVYINRSRDLWKRGFRLVAWLLIYWFFISVIIAFFGSIVSGFIDYILGLLSLTAPSLYMGKWHPETIKTLLSIAYAENLTIDQAFRFSTAFPTWGFIVDLVIISIFMLKITKWTLSKLCT